jgi:hypothetical protein
MIWLLAQPAKQKQLKLIVSVFWCMDGLPRFDGPVLISDMRILGPPLTPAPNGRFGSKSEVTALRRDVCFCPVSGHRQAVSACPKSAPQAVMPPSAQLRG